MAAMVHRPKVTQSTLPYGQSKNTIVSTTISSTFLITSEFWNASPTHLLRIGSVVIARKGYTWKTTWELGKHFVVTQVYAVSGDLLGTLWNICSEVVKINGGFVYEDWYLDIWSPVLGTPQLFGESSLEEAVDKGYISLSDADTAKWTAFRVLELFKVD